MDQNTLHAILDLYAIAQEDEEYLALYEEYTPARDALTAFWCKLPANQQNVIGDYLLTATALHHQLFALAIKKNRLG